MSETSSLLHNTDLRLLRIFKQVVESRGFSAAEETLGIGRSTISKHISDLEIRIGFRLCERGRAGFQISPHGETVYKAIVELLDALEQFQARVSHAKRHLVGALTLCLMDNTASEQGNPICRALRALRQRPGSLHLTVNVTTPDLVEQAVASRLAHVGLTICRSGLPSLVYQQVGIETSSLYCATAHPQFGQREGPVSLDEAIGADFVTRSYLVAEERAPTHRSRTSATALHVEGTLQLVLTGGFVSTIPDHIARPWVQAGMLKAIDCGAYRRSSPIYLVTRQQSLEWDAVRATIEDIRHAYDTPVNEFHSGPTGARMSHLLQREV